MSDSKLHLNRRRLLQAGLASGAVGATGLGATKLQADASDDGVWRNWSGYQTARPAAMPHPKSEEALIDLVKNGASPFRAVGAGHSFAPLVPTDGTIVSLDQISGVIDHDPTTNQARVYGGTSIRDLGPALWERGLSLPNQGDVDPQSISGAVGTSTHGTGKDLPSLSSAPVAIRLVDAGGKVHECSADENPDLFNAARCAMGSCGLFTEMTLQCVPAYGLKGRQWLEPLETVLAEIDHRRDTHRHFEFWMFPYSDHALVKILDETDELPPVQPEPEPPFLSEDFLMKMASELVGLIPSLNAPIQQRLDSFIDPTNYYGPAYQVFPSPRDVRFNEMEYQVPAEKGPEAIMAVREAIQKAGIPVAFPVEYRYVKADEIWLSPFEGRDAASISIHRYHKEDFKPLYEITEPILRDFGGRPHWGKLHTQDSESLKALYPHWDDFQRVRKQIDPDGRFLNKHLASLFG